MTNPTSADITVFFPFTIRDESPRAITYKYPPKITNPSAKYPTKLNNIAKMFKIIIHTNVANSISPTPPSTFGFTKLQSAFVSPRYQGGKVKNESSHPAITGVGDNIPTPKTLTATTIITIKIFFIN